ncbi:MAG: hypothetical protein HYX92_05020 [Chloroflexi bacterium]|nr:hypothetical protein [Chloroflexota bacterium]
MAVLDRDIVRLLADYLRERATAKDVAVWLASYDWDEKDPEKAIERIVLGQVELLTTDVSEGIADQGELRQLAASILASLGSGPGVAGAHRPPKERITK